MMKYSHALFIFFTAVYFGSAGLTAQPVTPHPKARFHSFNSVQLLNGKSTTSLSVHSVNGLQLGRLFTGIGTGFDYYYHTSVPLFLEARYDLLGTERKLQLFTNGGLQLPFGNANKREPWKTGDFKAGRLFAAGLDYFIPLKKDAVVIGAAFSQKKITQMVNNNVWHPVINRIENVPIKESYEFNRVWIKVGWVF